MCDAVCCFNIILIFITLQKRYDIVHTSFCNVLLTFLQHHIYKQIYIYIYLLVHLTFNLNVQIVLFLTQTKHSRNIAVCLFRSKVTLESCFEIYL